MCLSCCLSPSQNVKLSSFTSKSCSESKEMYRKACCTCKVVVLSILTYYVFDVLIAVDVTLAPYGPLERTILVYVTELNFPRYTCNTAHKLQVSMSLFKPTRPSFHFTLYNDVNATRAVIGRCQ